MNTTSALSKLRKALKECEVTLRLSEPGPRDDIVSSEDGDVKRLCDRIGYGAVMDSAARQWAKLETYNGMLIYGDISAFTVGPCRGTVRHALKLAREALAATKKVEHPNPCKKCLMGAR